MLPKKVLFIGLGGAGQRHLRIFNEFLPPETEYYAYRQTKTTPLLTPSFEVDDSKTLESAFNLCSFEDMDKAFLCEPDLTVISTPTSLHKVPMLKAAEANSGVFVEKPWAENLDKFDDFANQIIRKKLPFHISFQRRFNSEILSAFNAIKSGKIGRPISATFNVFSYVPAWHKYEDWKSLYAVRKDLGGGVLLTEIHEIDLACWFFGAPINVFCVGGNLGNDRLDVEDTIQATLIYSDFSIQITLCFMHRQPSRNFHIIGSKGDIVWSEQSQKCIVRDFDVEQDLKNASIANNQTNDDVFRQQARKFLSDWSPEDTKASLSAAFNSLAVVEAAKRSIKTSNPEALQALPSILID